VTAALQCSAPIDCVLNLGPFAWGGDNTGHALAPDAHGVTTSAIRA
jgi:hypothetical protein